MDEILDEAPGVLTRNSQGSAAEVRAMPEEPAYPKWPAASVQPELGQDEVHVWSFCLDACPVSVARFGFFLSSDERERAARFRFEQHRNRYIAGRGWLRVLLGCYLGTSPEQIKFVYGTHGKPALCGKGEHNGIHFNLAHSDTIALAGVTRSGPIGLDIECIRILDDMGELVKRFFSERENSAFEELKGEKRLAGFFNLWTRKEAWLKATGEGISQYLNQVEVSFLPGEPALLLKVPEQFQPAQRWSLHDLIPKTGSKAALAIAVKEARVHCWQWPDQNASNAI